LMRSNTSCGMTARSSAAFALTGSVTIGSTVTGMGSHVGAVISWRGRSGSASSIGASP
jgi:hypothetical protein